MMKKFVKVLKTGQTRTRHACQMIVDESLYPHSHWQIETYLKKYHDKPELIRDSIIELINRPSTPTYIDEQRVWRLYHHCALQVSQILKSMKLKKIRQEVASVIRKAETMAQGCEIYEISKNKNKIKSSSQPSRPACSGPEAKAAWMIRRDVFEFILSAIKAAELIQRHVRTYLLRKKFLYYMSNRFIAVGILQRNIRRWVAYRRALFLRRQQTSPWEQLWDSRYNRLYYYNIETEESQYYEPPGGIYRPLIREKNSAALIQSWPSLRPAVIGTLPTVTLGPDESIPNLLCNICHLRKCVKYCLDCRNEEDTGLADSIVTRPVSYCQPCFTSHHPELDPEKSKHRSRLFEDLNAPATKIGDQPFLKCCMCDEMATRKCLGPLDDDQINIIYKQLQRLPVPQWRQVLHDAHVGGERRIATLMDQLAAEADQAKHQLPGIQVAISAQLNLVRSALERMRAECDECYCKSCYQQVHSGGKRALHRWVGFEADCKVCTVCTSTPAEFFCRDCGCDYCDACFKVFHNMGRKKKHRKEVLMEELGEGQDYCFLCSRRAANKCPFERCTRMVCESCFEFKHKDKCPFSSRSRPQSRSPERPVGYDLFDSKVEPKCVVCGEVADRRCLQCGDLYCSIVRPDNAGCFAEYHSKGNRAAHTTETLINEKLQAARQSLKQKLAQDKVIKQRLGY
eukprot:scaffold1287_cov253-Ochromonas_danica.AAC.15